MSCSRSYAERRNEKNKKNWVRQGVMFAPPRLCFSGKILFGVNGRPLALSRAVRFGTGGRGKLFERSEFLPRRFRNLATGAVSVARLPFLLVLFFGHAKKRMPIPQGDSCVDLSR